MSYELVVKPSAEKQLRRLSKSLQRRIVTKISEIQTKPRSASATKIAGAATTWRVRIGDYRVVYEIYDSEQMIFVTIIAHRREVYRGL